MFGIQGPSVLDFKQKSDSTPFCFFHITALFVLNKGYRGLSVLILFFFYIRPAF